MVDELPPEVGEVLPDVVQEVWTADSLKVCQVVSLLAIPRELPATAVGHQHVVAPLCYKYDLPDGFSGRPGGREKAVMNE